MHDELLQGNVSVSPVAHAQQKDGVSDKLVLDEVWSGPAESLGSSI